MKDCPFYYLSKQASSIQDLTNIFWIIDCIFGALCYKELFTLAAEIGFSRPFLVTAAPVPIDKEDFRKILGRIFLIYNN